MPTCYRLNVCVLQKFILKPNPCVLVFGGKDFGRGLSHKGEAFMNGISDLINEALERSFTPSAMSGHSKKKKSLSLNQIPNLPAP